MRVSGARHLKRRKASPENLVSAMNAGKPAANSTTTVQGENFTSKAPKLTSEMAFCARP